MSPAVRPTGPVIRMLNSLHLTYMTSITRPAYDQFMSSRSNWISRRRAAHIIAHQCDHDAWGIILARQFGSYWGHVARLDVVTRRPVRLALDVYGVAWTLINEGIDKRRRGWWPNAVRFLQLAWMKGRGAGQPGNWTEAAQDRALWKEAQQTWLEAQGLPSRGQVRDPQRVDLFG